MSFQHCCQPKFATTLLLAIPVLLAACVNTALGFSASSLQSQPARIRHQDFCFDGQRARLYRHDDEVPTRRFLVLIPGMAQTIQTWDAQATALLLGSSSGSALICCEPLGLGRMASQPKNDGETVKGISAAHRNVTLPRQAEQMQQTLQAIAAEVAKGDDKSDNNDIDSHQRYDLVGFSLGGRIAMAFACLYPDQVRTLHLTGVGWGRSPRGKMYVAAWKDTLGQVGSGSEKSTLRAFAWLALLATYSPQFLYEQKEKIPIWVDVVAKSHTVVGLNSLMEQTHPFDDENDTSTVPSMAHRIKVDPPALHLCFGALDEMIGMDQFNRLADELRCTQPEQVSVLMGRGHAVPFEAARAWRASVLQHISRHQATKKK